MRNNLLVFILLFCATAFILKLQNDLDLLAIENSRLKIKNDCNYFEPLEAKNSCYLDAMLKRDVLEAQQRLSNKNYNPRIVYMEFIKWTKVGHAAVCFYDAGHWRAYDPSVGTAVLNHTDPNEIPDPSDFVKILHPEAINSKWMP